MHELMVEKEDELLKRDEEPCCCCLVHKVIKCTCTSAPILILKF